MRTLTVLVGVGAALGGLVVEEGRGGGRARLALRQLTRAAHRPECIRATALWTRVLPLATFRAPLATVSRASISIDLINLPHGRHTG